MHWNVRDIFFALSKREHCKKIFNNRLKFDELCLNIGEKQSMSNLCRCYFVEMTDWIEYGWIMVMIFGYFEQHVHNFWRVTYREYIFVWTQYWIECITTKLQGYNQICYTKQMQYSNLITLTIPYLKALRHSDVSYFTKSAVGVG